MMCGIIDRYGESQTKSIVYVSTNLSMSKYIIFNYFGYAYQMIYSYRLKEWNSLINNPVQFKRGSGIDDGWLVNINS